VWLPLIYVTYWTLQILEREREREFEGSLARSLPMVITSIYIYIVQYIYIYISFYTYKNSEHTLTIQSLMTCFALLEAQGQDVDGSHR